jgi:hypothetical protein
MLPVLPVDERAEVEDPQGIQQQVAAQDGKNGNDGVFHILIRYSTFQAKVQ